MQSTNPVITVALADDHVVLRQGLAHLVNTFERCNVIFQASNGKEVLSALKGGEVPDVLILDLSMPEMDGFETAQWLFIHFPQVHILILSGYDSELIMIRLLHSGVKGFLKKDISPDELKLAIETVMSTGFYYAPHASVTLINLIRSGRTINDMIQMQRLVLDDKELLFLKLCTEDLSYREIGLKMNLNVRYIEKLRKNMFEKIGVESRVGMVMLAVRNGLVVI